MSFESEIAKELEVNVVVLIDGNYWAVKEPDTGLVIADEFLQVKVPRINGVTVDVRRANTPISTFSFNLMEYEYNKTSSKIMLDPSQFLEKEVVAYIGHINGSFDFADYIEIARTKITSVKKVVNGYAIGSKEVSSLLSGGALNRSDSLQTTLIPASTTLDIVDASLWATSGLIKVDSEFMAYSSKVNNTISGLTRGIFGTTAEGHDVGAEVYHVTEFNGVNPVDIILQILLSNTGNGANNPTYDVLDNGLNIDPANIDIVDFETTRDNNFLGELHSLLVYGADDMLKYLEKNILPSTNLRFITKNGKIAISLLDQINFNLEPQILDESTITGVPTWGLTSDKIVNKIIVNFDLNPATGKYEQSLPFTDSDSIATYGEKKPLKINMPSVITGANGVIIATERANRLLGRLSTARGKVTVKCDFTKSNLSIGDAVKIEHRYLPQQGGTLGFSDQLEVMSRAVDLTKMTVTYKLEFTSYTGIRIPFIAPSPTIVNVLSPSSYEISDASHYEVEDRITFFYQGAYLLLPYSIIKSIVGNVVTFYEDVQASLINGIIFKIPDYDEANDRQRSRYGFIGTNTGFFQDDSKSYQIIF